MRQCPCGGLVRQHDLSGSRQVWTCNSCGRREVLRPAGHARNLERLTEKEKDELWIGCKVDGQCLNVEASMKLIGDVESALIQKNTQNDVSQTQLHQK